MAKSMVDPLLKEMRTDIRDQRRFRVAPSQSGPKKVFINCHYCGYSPARGLPHGGVCPKCGGSAWERFAISRKLLPPHML